MNPNINKLDMITLLLSMVAVYVVAITVMFCIKEGWMSKGDTADKIVTEKGLYRKVFIIAGAVAILITAIITLLIE